MGLVVVVLVLALAVGGLAGRLRDGPGNGSSLAALRGRTLVLAAVLAQAVGALVGGRAWGVGLAGSAVLAAAFLAVNRGLRGTGLLALGLLANAVAVLANGAMPVDLPTAVRAGVSAPSLEPVVLGSDPRHELRDAATRLPLLGDVVPVPLPGRPEVDSPGDVLVAAGLGELVVLALAGSGRPRDRVAALQ